MPPEDGSVHSTLNWLAPTSTVAPIRSALTTDAHVNCKNRTRMKAADINVTRLKIIQTPAKPTVNFLITNLLHCCQTLPGNGIEVSMTLAMRNVRHRQLIRENVPGQECHGEMGS